MLKKITWINSSDQGSEPEFDKMLNTLLYTDSIDRRYEPLNHSWIGQVVTTWNETGTRPGNAGTAFVARVAKRNKGADTVMFIITAAHNI